MKKVFSVIGICMLIVFSIVSLIAAFANGNRGIINEDGRMVDAVANEEIALKIGKALLEEYFSDVPWDETPIAAEEKNGIWTVHNVVNQPETTDDGQPFVVKGGGLYVQFRKDNGKILKIGVND